MANAAFADDVGAGRAAPVAGPSKPVARRAAPGKDSGGPWANYSTAESLGLTDPDAERLANEAEIRRSQGTAGEWEVVSVTPTPAPEPQDEGEEDVQPDVATSGEKRPADATGVDEEDTRSYKLRKKTLNPGGLLGNVYDPGMIPIRVKKREEPVKQEETVTKEEEPLPPPSFKPLQLKPSKDTTDRDQATTQPAPSNSAPKWSKSGWGAAGPSPPMPAPPPPPLPQGTSTAEEAPAPITKEGETDVKPSMTDLKPAEAPAAPVFKKRKAPASSARGRRPI